MLLEGRYRLLHRSGAGTSAELWSAQDELLRRRVAVRVLPPGRAGATERFLAAGRLGARLAHPLVAAVYDVGIADLPDRGRTPYIVMEFADGHPLPEPEPAGWRRAVRVAADVAAALAHAHGQWVAHGNLSPAKIVLTDVGVKVIGFGVDVADDLDAPARDVHALGLLLAPVAGPGTPAELAGLVRRCLADDPARRPSAADAAGLLDQIATAPVPPAAEIGAESVPAPGSPRRWTKRTTLVAGAAAVTVLTLLAVAQAAPGALPWFDRLPQQATVPAPTDGVCDEVPIAQRFCAPVATPPHRPPTTASVGPRRTTRPGVPNPPPTPSPSPSPAVSSSAPADSPSPPESPETPASSPVTAPSSTLL
ncbi:hypothetical protein ACFFX1_16550 [Dactylosporangium sucinum]|uniref:non-specific serine/threonine protein kinase n=1 Tax=Dactylosporangium sucinum TaxID=1424081 RepID=A0A917TLG6_9ACTN|nr:hypothetical protein [Dactylosporangium sucinum]GGM26452.1 serine/threonine protein kinase [Dactylosporangium sucinum]